MSGKRILVLDDDTVLCQLIGLSAELAGITCIATGSLDRFLDELGPELDLILIDLMMPKIDGIQFLRVLGERGCQTPIVLMSGLDVKFLETAEALGRSQGLDVVGHLCKPFQMTDMYRFLERDLDPPLARVASTMTPDDSHLIDAIRHEEFVLHYQPQIEMNTGEVIGVEALVRWQHPQFGLIYPNGFIARCERLNLINVLGTLVADQGLAAISPLKRRNGQPLLLSLNISPFSLLDPSLPDALFALTQKYNRTPDSVVLEVAESAAVRNVSPTLEVLARLRMKGFKLSIDNFGTGYSMMEELRNIPANEIKIDRSLVMDLENKNSRVAVISAIEIGHALELKVVAEGVETWEHLDFLMANRCDIAQGYLFSRPLPLDGLLTWLQGHSAELESLQARA